MQRNREDSARTIEACAAIGRGTGLFNDAEIDVLIEVLEECFEDPETTYRYLEERQDGRIVGFLLYGKIPMTLSAWDLYWVAVERNLQGRGIGKTLLSRMQQEILADEEWGVIRLETAGRDAYTPTRTFYERTGFQVAGIIPDFYRAGDSLITYCRSISR